ncbi:MAG: hypothetical protein AVDCRST_MAG32-882 [uncultured Nocardioides sp.]|uniref:Uncharacterized protein n=1 Tax=uncultured Nocardioides sp. TaxID=198441 RepID=A0A6J4MZ19_9ACTN|nr:MAG: hypothetical protein AVDCRST_MAG32-882 [uncultured Nocardioides sp.]
MQTTGTNWAPVIRDELTRAGFRGRRDARAPHPRAGVRHAGPTSSASSMR